MAEAQRSAYHRGEGLDEKGTNKKEKHIRNNINTHVTVHTLSRAIDCPATTMFPLGLGV